MTMNVVIAAKNGISVASDGKSIDKDGNVLSLKEQKVFRLSNLCVILVSGYIPSNIGLTMMSYEQLFRDFKIFSVTEIAKKLSSFLKSAETEFTKDKTKPANLIIAGYDLTEVMGFNPHIYYLTKEWNWDLCLPQPNQYVAAAGEGYHDIKKVLDKEYANGSELLEQANTLTLWGVLKGEKERPDVIGGRMRLWNIVPGKPIRTFSPKEIIEMQSNVQLDI